MVGGDLVDVRRRPRDNIRVRRLEVAAPQGGRHDAGENVGNVSGGESFMYEILERMMSTIHVCSFCTGYSARV